MTEFMKFNKALTTQFNRMVKEGGELFQVEGEKNDVWSLYLASFPEGTNPIYKERTVHDCNCCKQYIRDIGEVVAIIDGKLESIFDVEVGGTFQVVADALSEHVKSQPIKNVYRHYQKKVGTPHNFQEVEGGRPIKWEHFNLELPKAFVETGSIGTVLGDKSTNQALLKRSLEEISLEAIDIVKDLIDQNSIYRGQEHSEIVNKLRRVKTEYDSLDEDEREIFLWQTASKLNHAGRFKNTVIGTLLMDISAGIELEDAVKMFESKVAPHNYKRSSALITQGMIDKANKTVASLDIEDSLHRRYAVESDLTINNVLFADRSAKGKMGGALDVLEPTAKKNINLDKVEEIGIEEFIEKVLPRINTMDVMVKNNQMGNFVSLIAPQHAEAKGIFKWGNNFSWSYNGEVTDSIKERVKAAGGVVDAEVRASLSWYNYDDLDLSVVEPNGNVIYFGDRRSQKTGGMLDVDMNAGGGNSRTPVENIFWKNKSKMTSGEYKVVVHNFSKRETKDVGFEVEFEYDGEVVSYSHPQDLKGNNRVTVLTFNYHPNAGITIGKKGLKPSTASKEVWGVTTESWQPVKMVMNSPNHWDGGQTGNKHVFFMLDKCANPDQARGFYNEFLDNSLNEHRKVFEVLASKLKTEPTEHQLSGLGFSSTKRGELLCKVSGSFNRSLLIKF